MSLPDNGIIFLHSNIYKITHEIGNTIKNLKKYVGAKNLSPLLTTDNTENHRGKGSDNNPVIVSGY